MGNTRSEFFEPVSVDLWWSNDRTNKPEVARISENQQTIRKANEAKMAEVEQEISSLHEKRRRIIAEKKKEMDGLRQQVARQQKENEALKEFLREKGFEPPNQEWDITKVDVSLQTETFEVPGISNTQETHHEVELELTTIKGKNLELQKNIAELQKDLQGANSELAAFENERKEYKTHVTALKDIITVSKTLLLMRESQVKELTQKVAEIQASLPDIDLKAFSDELREEYQRQLQNIKQLRVMYEERQRADKNERDNLKSQLEEAQGSLKTQETKNGELQERVEELEKDNSNKYDTIVNLESQLGLTKAECGELRAEMSVINQLFSQILLGFNNGQEIDLDKLIKTLEENHDLLKDIVVNEECNELSSALPKVLLDLVSQVHEKTKISPCNSQEEPSSSQTLSTIAEESESQTSTQQNSLSSASEIVQNLPKVWKVLTELLSHQSAPISVLNENNDMADADPCYKSVQTPTGPTMVLSVSKTYIRLKDLIIEKKSLEKETARLKQLNTHLETRLQDQEKRLGLVSHELSKTWHVVGKMQKQHQQLHTQEKILRYELAQKRKLLNELKEELEYCREKWLQAREKNSTTEEQWKQLRNEFASRKNTVSEDLNNSVESGYSDERESSSSDDEIDETETVNSEMVPGCSSASENCEINNAEVQNEGQNGDGNNQILKVVKEEIAKIENASGEGSSKQVEEEIEPNVLVSEELTDRVENASDISSVLNGINENEDVEEVSESNNVLSSPNENDSSELENRSIEMDLSSSSMVAEISELPSNLEQNEDRTSYMLESLEESEQLTGSNIADNYDLSSPEEEDSCQIDVPSSSLIVDAISQEQIEDRTTEIEVPSPTSPMVVEIVHPATLVATINMELENIELNGSNHDQKSTDLVKIEDEVAAVLNGSAEEVHSKEPLKTDLVQNQEVQKDTSKTPEEVLADKEERLKRLEKEAKHLVAQTASTSSRSVEICSKLDDLHEQYGGEPKNRRKDIDDMYKKLEEDILQTIKKTQSGEEYPSTSRHNRSPEETLAAKEDCLKRLAEQSNELVNQAATTSQKGLETSSKLDSLHQQYGEKSNDELLGGGTSIMEEPSTSSGKTPEEILARREERLQRMEEQAQQLVRKARRNSLRNSQFCRKLNKLHDRYGESSDSSDEGADDNNNNNADGVETQNEDVSVSNEAQLHLEETETVQEEEKEEEK